MFGANKDKCCNILEQFYLGTGGIHWLVDVSQSYAGLVLCSLSLSTSQPQVIENKVMHLLKCFAEPRISALLL